jgi:hypothetical protein
MRHYFTIILLTILSIGLTGCATPPQPPVDISNNFWQEKNKTIGVIMSDIPEPETTIVGANCLLCYGVAAAANSSLDKHLKTIPTEDVAILKQKVLDLLTQRGMKAELLDDDIVVTKLAKFKSKEPNVAKKDFTSFQKRSLDYLLVIDVHQVGAHRTYASYVPTSDPLSVFSGQAYIIDLKTNKYAWYFPFNHKKPADLEWDEPPSFPGLTNSLYEVITLGHDSITDSLGSQNTSNLPTNAAVVESNNGA